MNQRTGLRRSVWLRRFWIVPPLLIGAAAIFLAPMFKTKPAQVPPQERAVKVRAIKITPMKVIPRAVGYGTVRPSKSWEAVAEVAGQVEWVSDDLKNGRRVAAGTELLRIEDVNYRLALAQMEAQLKAADLKDSTTRASLAFAEQDLKILQEDYERKKGLMAKGATTKTAVEAAERQLLNGQTQVQNLKNAIDINAVDRQVVAAQRDSARLDLKRTHIVAPFDVRVTDVRIGEAQYANKGQMLFSADGVAVAEVEAQFPIGILRPLIGAVAPNDPAAPPQRRLMGLNAVARLHTATHTVEWKARIDRTSGIIDPQTQSIGVVVAIDDPEGQAKPTERPNLLRNMFVEVELIAPPLEAQIVVPRASVHDGQVYVVDGENRLDIRKAQVAFTRGTLAVLKGGVKPNEKVVTSELASAVEGMLLAPQEDRKTKRNLVVEATGEEPKK